MRWLHILILFLTLGFFFSCNQTNVQWVLDGEFIPPPENPILTIVYPESGQENIGLGVSLLFHSSMPLKLQTLDAGVSFFDETRNPIDFTITPTDDNVYKIVPDTLLTHSTTYSVILSDAIESLEGTQTGAITQSTFTTMTLDLEPPEIIHFTIDTPSPTSSATIDVTVEAEDNVGITHYLINEDEDVPNPDAFFETVVPTSYILSGDGKHTLYIWVLDESQRVNERYSGQTILLDTTKPEVGSCLTVPTITAEQTINIGIEETDNDGSGVIKWLIKEESSTPLPADFILESRPTTFTLSSGYGEKTLYFWVMDAVDNISDVKSSLPLTYYEMPSSIEFGGPGGIGNPVVTVPSTQCYDGTLDCVLESEFFIGNTGLNPSRQIALSGFLVNRYEVTNKEYQHNFFDLNGDGILDDSAYFNSSLVGPSGLTAQESWNLALDLDDLVGPDRTVTIHPTNGVSLGAAPTGTDSDESDVYSNIKGLGSSLSDGVQGAPDWSSGTTTPWLNGGMYENLSNGEYTPVIFVSWYEARAYCKFVYGERGDLPTEAQWERASKGTNNEDYLYPWGLDAPNNPSCRANYDSGGSCYLVNTTTVGSYSLGETKWISHPSLFDMSGNVAEWCHTWYDSSYPYEGGESGTNWNNRLNPSKRYKGLSLYRVLRGGSWLDDETYLQSAHRFKYAPKHRHSFIGFRCVVSSP
jgi:formylglycine-generating enzyme required for sulfatase activity